jgi:predicted permease
VGAGLAVVAAVLLAFVPRLPSAVRSRGVGLEAGGHRMTGTNRRLRMFAATQIAASFVLLTGAAMLLRTLLTLQATDPGFETRQVLAVNVPITSFGRTPDQIRAFYRELQDQVSILPGVQQVAVGSTVPWRDAGGTRAGFSFAVEGRAGENGLDDPRAKFRSVSPGFFAALGVPILAGRDFTEADRNGSERVVIVSRSVAERLFPAQEALNRRVVWTDSVMRFIDVSTEPRRIVGIVPDLDDENIEPAPVMTVYHPFEQEIGGGRLFVHTATDPYALVAPITRVVRELAADQPVERASTLEDVRADVLMPTRLNTIVFGGFAAVALAISVVGVAGVLAFSVGGRTREFGIRLAVGSQPSHLLRSVLVDGIVMAVAGVAAGAAAGFALARLVGAYVGAMELPGVVPVIGSAVVLLAAALLASLLPAARAARVDVIEALRD